MFIDFGSFSFDADFTLLFACFLHVTNRKHDKFTGDRAPQPRNKNFSQIQQNETLSYQGFNGLISMFG